MCPVPAELLEGYASELHEPFNNTQGENPYTIHQDLQDVMQRYIGVFRTEENISTGIKQIEGLKQRRGRSNEGSLMFNPGWHLCRILNRC